MTIPEAAAKLRPGTSWNLRGSVLEQAIDDSPRVSVPSAEEIQAVLDAAAYAAKRVAEYPAIADQLDALWKGGAAAESMASQIRAIKAKYPKPQESI